MVIGREIAPQGANIASEFTAERALIIDANAEAIYAAIENPTPLKTTAYERYLAERLRGIAPKSSEVLAALSLSALVDVIEVLGKAIVESRAGDAVLGKAIVESRAGDDADRPAREIRDIGFRVMTGTYEEFKAKMLDVWPLETSPHVYNRFGSFGRWLRAKQTSSLFDPIKEFIARLISETSSAGPGDEILGFHVDKRTWHSVQSVADIAKTANKTIWRICKNRGWITDAEPKKANSEYRLPFEDGEALIDELADAVPEFYIAKRLGARTDVGRSLVDAGILSHIPGTGMGGVDPLVSKASADSFFEILHSKLRFTPNSSRIAIHSVVARTRARLADLIAAIIEDRLAAEITSEGLELSNICLNVADVYSASADPAFVRTTKVARHVKWKSLPSRKKI